MFIGDDVTPPECLKRYLQDHLKTRASLLNTGVLGYSPEQYYYSLIAFAGRFRPHFVVVSVYCNDFGNFVEVVNHGVGDWQGARYWLEKIIAYCSARQWTCMVVVVPHEPHMFGQRMSGNYPGPLTNILKIDGASFLDPIESFINEQLKLIVDGARKGRPAKNCSLFNAVIDDAHFSAAGAEVWAAAVGRRLILLREREQALREKAPTPGASAP
jgi:hypothetical protein